MNWFISSSVLILVIIIMRHIFRRKISLRLQYALWLLVAVRLLVPISFGSSMLSIENISDKVSGVQEISNRLDYADTEDVHQEQKGTLNNSSQIEYNTQQKPEKDKAEMLLSLEEQKIYPVIHQNKSQIDIKKIGTTIWLCGMIFMGAVFSVVNLSFLHSVKSTRERVIVENISLPVFVSKMVETPCLFGLFRPTIYVTESVAEQPVLLRHALSHEMMHYKHGDLWWSIVRIACLVIHWFNPLVWWAAVLSKQDGELACDESTIRHLGENERAEYGRTLIRLTCEKPKKLLVASTTMVTDKKNIKERILLIAHKPKVRIYTLILVGLVVAVSVRCAFTNAMEREEREAIDLTEESSQESEEIVDAYEEINDEQGERKEEEELTFSIQEYYITNIGNPCNLYYIDQDKVLWACGGNQHGQLGQGTSDYDFHEEMIKIAENVVHVHTSFNDFVVYLTEDHKLYGMGKANYGQLLGYEELTAHMIYNSDLFTVNSPKLLMENVAYAVCGKDDVVCMLTDGSVWTWGTIWYWGDAWYENEHGYCFDSAPRKLLENAVYITGGWENHSALLTDGSVWTWGYNYEGNCGAKDVIYLSEPVKVAEDAVMVWTESMEKQETCLDISEYPEINPPTLTNTVLLKRDGTYWACGRGLGQEKILSAYWERIDNVKMVCSDEFWQIDEDTYREMIKDL